MHSQHDQTCACVPCRERLAAEAIEARAQSRVRMSVLSTWHARAFTNKRQLALLSGGYALHPMH